MNMTTKEVFARYADAETFSKIVEYADVATMWEHSAATYGERVALIDGGKEISYSELDGEVARFRTVLRAHGLKKGDRVGLILRNSRDFVRAYLAAVTLGLVAAVLPAHLNDAAVFGCTAGFGLRAVIAGEDLMGSTALVAQRLPSVCILSAGESAENMTPAERVEGGDDCVIMFTGGTTGKSKGVRLSHGAVMQGTVNGCYGYRDVFGPIVAI